MSNETKPIDLDALERIVNDGKQAGFTAVDTILIQSLIAELRAAREDVKDLTELIAFSNSFEVREQGTLRYVGILPMRTKVELYRHHCSGVPFPGNPQEYQSALEAYRAAKAWIKENGAK